jgi:hypothetical protein
MVAIATMTRFLARFIRLNLGVTPSKDTSSIAGKVSKFEQVTSSLHEYHGEA